MRVPTVWVLVLSAVLAGWSFVTAGVFDGPAATDLRGSSVYVGSTWQVDEAAAEAVVGNRRLTVAFIDDERPRDVCDDTDRAAGGTLLAIVFRDREDPDDVDIYGCSQIPGLTADDNIGRAAVVETRISAGAEELAENPIDLLKVMAANFDMLVRMEFLPGDARTIEAAAPRYLVAFLALGLAVMAAGTAWWTGRRAGRAAAAASTRRDELADRRAELDTQITSVATAILTLDPKARATSAFGLISADYSQLIRDLAAARDAETLTKIEKRLVAMRTRLRRVRG